MHRLIEEEAESGLVVEPLEAEEAEPTLHGSDSSDGHGGVASNEELLENYRRSP